MIKFKKDANAINTFNSLFYWVTVLNLDKLWFQLNNWFSWSCSLAKNS